MSSPSGYQAANRSELVAIAVIVIAAFTIRLVNLDASLWYDEIITLVQSVRLPSAELIKTYGSLNNHVLYTWLAKGFSAVFGETPAALRFPAVVFGAASILAVWRLFRLDGLKWAAVSAAALLAVSYHHVWFSQNARGYTGLLLFTTLAAYYFSRALKSHTYRDWILYGLSIAIAMLLHLSAAFFVAAQGLTVICAAIAVSRREGMSQLGVWLRGPALGYVLGAAIVIAIFSPMLAGMAATLGSVSSAGADATRQVLDWRNPLWTLFESLKSFGVLSFAFPLAFGFIVLGVVRLLERGRWIIIPYLIHIPLTFIVLTSLSMRVWPRYFFVDIGFMFAALVVGAFWFAEIAAKYLKIADRTGLSDVRLKALGVAVMIGASLPLLMTNFRRPKQDFDGAYAMIERNASEADIKVALGLSSVFFNDYRGLNWPSPQSVDEFRSLEEHGGRVWVVTAFPAHARAYYREIQSELDKEFELMGRFSGTLSGGEVTVYRSAVK